MSTDVATRQSRTLDDPSEIGGYPATLPIEVALRQQPIRQIFAAYNLDKDDYERLKADPLFLEDVRKATEMLREEGMSFKVKARMQSEELLKRSWELIQNRSGSVPPNVQADLIKFTWRVAGLDASKDQAASQVGGTGLQIVMHLGG